MKKIIFTIPLILISHFLPAQDLNGIWYGNLEVQPEKFMLFIFHISQENGITTTEIEIPSQQAKGLKVQGTSYEKGKLSIDASNFGFKYAGVLNLESNEIEGRFLEGIHSVPLNLSTKEINEIRKKRPQEPVKPFPYTALDVKFPNPKDGIVLAGTLTLPDKVSKKFPAVILITGSGPQNRDEEMFGHKPFLVLADYLTRNGIAVLRYDDRGTAESTGNFSTATSADFAQDALSAIEYLKSRNDIDFKNIGIIGHSEGGSIAPLIASHSKEVAHIVMLAGSGISGRDLADLQAKAENGFRPEAIEDVEAYIEFNLKVLKIASSKKSIPQKKKVLEHLYKSVESNLKAMVAEDVNVNDIIQQQINTVLSPWSQYFYSYNPADELRKLKIPVLSLFGTNDLQVDPVVNQKAIEKALTKAGNNSFTSREFTGLNHFFQESNTGKISEYSGIEQTISPIILEEINKWIHDNIK